MMGRTVDFAKPTEKRSSVRQAIGYLVPPHWSLDPPYTATVRFVSRTSSAESLLCRAMAAVWLMLARSTRFLADSG